MWGTSGVRWAFFQYSAFALRGIREKHGSLTEGNDRVPAQRLLHDCVDVRERRLVSEVREAVRADDLIKLPLRLPLDVRVEHHGEEERAQGRDGLHIAVNGWHMPMKQTAQSLVSAQGCSCVPCPRHLRSGRTREH